MDQLGSCKDCHAAVSSIEAACSICGSENIDRKKDSKWLINIRDDAEFSRILEPAYYYFVLFEPIENHSDVQVSIWQADPKTKGFAYMLMDYYLNIRPASESHAALDLWPYHIKFCLTQPTLIYRSTITAAGKIKISVFPTRGNTRIDELPSLDTFAQSTTLKRDLLVSLVQELNIQRCALPEKTSATSSPAWRNTGSKTALTTPPSATFWCPESIFPGCVPTSAGSLPISSAPFRS